MRICIACTNGRGAAAARNIGLDMAEGEYVFFLDDDDEWMPEKCEKQLQYLNQTPEAIGVTCGRTVIRTGNPLRYTCPDESVLNRTLKWRNLTGSFSFFGFRREIDTKHLRLDESLVAAQDFEFYIRISKFGRIGVVPGNLAFLHHHNGHRISDNLKGRIDSYNRIYQLNREQLTPGEKLYLKSRIHSIKARDSRGVSRLWKKVVQKSLAWTARQLESIERIQ